MKNIFLYYYNIDTDDIYEEDDYIKISYNLEEYCFIQYKRDIKDIDILYQISEEMINKGILVHKLILNKENKLITPYNDKYYVLLKVLIDENRNLTYDDINIFLNNTKLIKNSNILNKTNWNILWENKNDYLEYQIGELGVKYPLLRGSFSYYIGLAENAIMYFNNIKKNNLELSINHKKNKSLFDLYNPLEFIIDNKSRDISEYIKYIFYNEHDNLWDNVYLIFNNSLTNTEVNLIYARLLYPTYYFSIYDKIINDNYNKKNILTVIEKSHNYEEFLSDLFYYLSDYYNLDRINWITTK